jgi:hypothetical protein
MTAPTPQESLDSFKQALLEAPDYMLDQSMKELIQKWQAPPKALEVLEVLDHCVHGALAGGVIVMTLQIMFGITCELEQVTKESQYELATWRGKGQKAPTRTPDPRNLDRLLGIRRAEVI